MAANLHLVAILSLFGSHLVATWSPFGRCLVAGNGLLLTPPDLFLAAGSDAGNLQVAASNPAGGASRHASTAPFRFGRYLVVI